MSELTDVFGQAIDVNVGELQMYGNVNWLNALDELGKMVDYFPLKFLSRLLLCNCSPDCYHI